MEPQTPLTPVSAPPNEPAAPPDIPAAAPTPPASPVPEPPTPKRRWQREGFKGVISTILILLAAPLIALSLTAFVFQSYEVDGPSMSSTLENHDRLIVLKTARTWARLTGHDYIPHRNDVIIFVKHGLIDETQGKDKQLIKRVVGLPGDRVVVNNGVLTIYNKEHPDGFEPDKTYPYGNVITTTPGKVDLVVPAGEVFVCGDNRVNSLDSRIFGTIPARDIVGKLILRLLPFSDIKKF
jgi:signal peptidase I